jgi:hypothetical protein
VADQRICEGCGKPLPPDARRNARYHSGACRTAAWRTRTANAAPVEDERTSNIPTRSLADALTAAVGRTAWALAMGDAADAFDVDRIQVISNALVARAMAANPEVDWTDSEPRPTVAVVQLKPSRDGTAPRAPERSAAAAPAEQEDSSRDGSQERGTAGRRPAAARSKRPPRMSRKQALAVIDAAALEKADDWRESSRWVLRSGETVLGVLAPDYSGLKRNGWSGTVHETSVRTERRPTREAAAATLADSWLRQVTAKPRRTVT